jgi:tocopherol O-methyltransferase
MNEVLHYYQEKTARLLDKYGPGPLVHYHVGYFGSDVDDDFGSPAEIRARIARAQTDLVRQAALSWEAGTRLDGRVLDLGCGLGGGALHWARNFGADVTAVTLVEEHARLVEKFAAELGLTDQVRTVVCDAAHLPPSEPFDAVVALESLCYMDRRAVFEVVARDLRPGGVFCVQDVFLRGVEHKAAFDQYWRTDIGTVKSYMDLAAQFGMELDSRRDLSERTTDFWLHSMAWTEARLAESDAGDPEHLRLLHSLREHARFYRAWRQGVFGIELLRFMRRG